MRTIATFTVVQNDFVLNDKPVRILSGAIHYFRVVPEYWHDRLLKLKAMGLNTVETYVAWNAHEPKPGQFDFSGMLDLVRFIRIAGDLGLMVIVRPGPYICSEWDLGALPSWLLADANMKLRCNYPPYLAAVDRFFAQLLPLLAPLQCTQGGPIVAMQVENEYGSYGNDTTYLRHLEQSMRGHGIDVLLFTSDGATDWMLSGGTLPHVLKVANFGSDPDRQFAKLREHQPEGPLMCGEFWNGWFDHWGEKHHTRDPKDVANTVERMLQLGASINIYMFHGGTNFGFTAGANCTDTEYQPDVTSYDSDAPLSEAGDPTPKYFALREVLSKYTNLTQTPVPPALAKKAYGLVTLTEAATLFSSLDILSVDIQSPTPQTMETLGQTNGFILYRTRVKGPREANPLILQDVHDRAQVFVDGAYMGVIKRLGGNNQLTLQFGEGEHQLDILVESMGRINYGPRLHDRKGITEGVRLDRQFLYDWTNYPLPLDNLSSLHYSPITNLEGPAFYRGSFIVDEPADTFLALPGWTKGVCFVNGFNLGRYWEIGPQETLYVPAPLLKAGRNELVIFELHGAKHPVVEFRDQASLG